MKTSFSILLVSDDAQHEVVQRELYLGSANRVFDFHLLHRTTIASALKSMREFTFGLIITELSVPDASDESSLRRLQEFAHDLPIIVLTPNEDSTQALKLISLGAQDVMPVSSCRGTLYKACCFALQRHALLKKVQDAEKNTRSTALAKSTFLANMSHEIRTPLTSIIGYSEMLLATQLPPAQMTRALSSIHSNGRHLLQVINDILDISKIEAGELRVERARDNLWPLLRDVKQTFSVRASEKNLSFDIELCPPLPLSLETDFFRLKQVLYNLVGNAVKFTNEGFVKIVLAVVDQKVIFEIRDSGVGIGNDAKDKLFKSFSQGDASRTKEFGGTGLGLVISNELVKRLDGHLTFESRKGVGSVFRIEVPLGAVGLETMTAQLPPLVLENPFVEGKKSERKLKGKILVVDDVEDNRQLISLYLTQAGLNADVAEDGFEALKRMSETTYDLVLLDMQMPKMDGMEVVRTVRAQGGTFPIVAITASILEESLHECVQAGCDSCLRKPFRSEELFDCIASYLSRDPQAGPGKPRSQDDGFKDNELQRVRQGFVRKLPDRLAEIDEAFSSSDLNRLRSEAHRFIGAGLFGYSELSHLAGVLESLVIQEQTGGLSLVESVIKKMKSEVQKIALHNRSEKEGSPQGGKYHGPPMVIVADDDEASLKMVCRLLNSKGFLANPARDAESAMKLCKEQPFAMLVTALEMRNMDGYQLVDRVRRLVQSTAPILVMTDRSPSEARSKLGELEVNGLLSKPVSKDQLFDAIDSLINQSVSV